MFSSDQTERIYRDVLYYKQEWLFFFSLSSSVLVLFIGCVNIKCYFGVFSGSMTATQCMHGSLSESRLNKIFVFKI